MPDDQYSKPPPIRSDRPPGGFLLRDAYEQFCDPEIWRQFVEARAAAPRRPERGSVVGADLKRCRNAVYADFWNRVETGEVAGFGHLGSLDRPARKIPLGEWLWLGKNPIENGRTFEGAGGRWHRVTFHLAAVLRDAESALLAKRVAAGAEDGWTTPNGWALAGRPKLFQVALDNWSPSLPWTPEAKINNERYDKATDRLRQDFLADCRSGKIRVEGYAVGADETSSIFREYKPIPPEVIAEYLDQIWFGQEIEPYIIPKDSDLRIALRVSLVAGAPRAMSAQARAGLPETIAPAAAVQANAPVGRPPRESAQAAAYVMACVEAGEIDFDAPQARAIKLVRRGCDVGKEIARRAVKPYFDTWKVIKPLADAGKMDMADPAAVAAVRVELARLADDQVKAFPTDEIIQITLTRYASR